MKPDTHTVQQLFERDVRYAVRPLLEVGEYPSKPLFVLGAHAP